MCGCPIDWVNKMPVNKDGSDHLLSCSYVSERRKAEIRKGKTCLGSVQAIVGAEPMMRS